MTSITNEKLSYASRDAAVGAHALAHGTARYVATVAMRISAFVLLPALFWSSIVAFVL